jgi:hypothetical protein
MTSTNQSSIELVLRDYNGYDFCGEKACNGQAKATELTALINRDYILKSEVLSAIGEDDPYDDDGDMLTRDKANEVLGRNELRASIKTKLGLS